MKKRGRKLVVMLAVLAVAVLVAGSAIYAQGVPAQDDVEAAVYLPARWSYAAKFVCGAARDVGNPPAEPDVKPGNYATKINIHNPNAETVRLHKRVVLSYPEGSDPIKPTRRFRDDLLPDFAMSVHCAEIVRLLVANDPAVHLPPFIEGFLLVDVVSPTSTAANVAQQVDVVTVYTAAPVSDPGAAVGWVSSIQVKDVAGRRLPAGNVQ